MLRNLLPAVQPWKCWDCAVPAPGCRLQLVPTHPDKDDLGLFQRLAIRLGVRILRGTAAETAAAASAHVRGERRPALEEDSETPPSR
jgi:hypothetical protein